MVRAVPRSPNVVLVIGHNPGLEELSHRRAAPASRVLDDERKRLDTLKVKFPTAALAVLDFEIESWDVLAPGTGALVDFIRPKSLNDG